VNEEVLRAELDQHFELLAEPVQTVMRKYQDIKDPYEKLKEFTRGRQITVEDYENFISSIEGFPDDEKERMRALRPHNYLGYAAELARNVKRY